MDDSDVYIEPEESEQDFVISTEPVVVTDYSRHASRVIESAQIAAQAAPGGILTCEHLLLGIANDPDCAAAHVLAGCGFSGELIEQTIAFIGGPVPVMDTVSDVLCSPRAERVIAGASLEAGNRNASRVDTLHLLFALLHEQKGIAVAALTSPVVGLEVAGAALSNALRNGMTDPS